MPLLTRLRRGFALIGFEPLRAWTVLKALPSYVAAYLRLREQAAASAEPFGPWRLNPCLLDRHERSGVAAGGYFHQDLFVAQRIFVTNPQKHVDVGSRVDGFVAHVAAFRSIEVVDIRLLETSAGNIRFSHHDIMASDFTLADYCDSVSCLHVLEHLGLGRYGDPVDFDGHQRGFENLRKMVKTGGKLYLSVPLGPQRIEFNAHRVFSLAYVQKMFERSFRLDMFSYVDDAGEIHADVRLDEPGIARNLDCNHGVAIFELTRLQ